MSETTVSTLEAEIAAAAEQLVAPWDDECLLHYLVRMLDAHGCHGHRFTQRWSASPRGSGQGALRWVKDNGGCCCDCEVVMNSFRHLRPSPRRDALLCATGLREVAGEDGSW